MKKLIELKGVSRTYGNGDQTRTVLKNVDLTIVAGHYRRAGCGDGHYVPRRYAGIDD